MLATSIFATALAALAASLDTYTQPGPPTGEATLLASELVQLKASAPGSLGLGGAVALFGDTLAAGATGEGLGGGVHVFVSNSGAWSSQAVLTPFDATHDDRFGATVALSGDTLAVGSPYSSHGGWQDAGSVYIYTRVGSSWNFEAKLTAGDPTADDHFGEALELVGDTLLVGASDAAGGGAVYEFNRVGAVWTEVAKLFEPGAADFGFDIALDGSQLLIGVGQISGGAWAECGAYLYTRAPSGWSLVTSLPTPIYWASGSREVSVALEGDLALVGAPHATATHDEAGLVFVFRRGSSGWSEEAQLVASQRNSGSRFGRELELVGDCALIGMPSADELYKQKVATNEGAVYLFSRSSSIPGTPWTERSILTPANSAVDDRFGSGLAVHGDRVAIGAIGKKANSSIGAGSAFVYGLTPSETVRYCTSGKSARGCLAYMTVTGEASTTASTGFTVTGNQADGRAFGLFFFSTVGRKNAPWGNGTSFQCVEAPVLRGPLMQATGTNGQCNGTFSQDLNAYWCATCPGAGKNPGMGAIVRLQLWYRDAQNTSNQKTVLSDALEFSVGL